VAFRTICVSCLFEQIRSEAVREKGQAPFYFGRLRKALLLVSTAMRSKKKRCMTKTLNLIHEAIRNTKHAFRQSQQRPAKAQKHRYERRKVKEIIRLNDWTAELEF
jgi:hypothetical protein